jgi:hypothetical protein
MAFAARSLSKTLPSIPRQARQVTNALPKRCHQIRHASVRQRGPDDPPPPSPQIRLPPSLTTGTHARHEKEANAKPPKLWPARLSIFGGSIFISILIYDMVWNHHVYQASQLTHTHTSTTIPSNPKEQKLLPLQTSIHVENVSQV